MTSSNTVLGEIQVRPLAPSGEGGSLVCGNPAPGHLHFHFSPLSKVFPWPGLQAPLCPMLSRLVTLCLTVVVFIDVSECRTLGM